MTKFEPIGMPRRAFLGGASAASIGAYLVSNGWADAAGYFSHDGADVDGLFRAGFDVRHTVCFQCGAYCGLTALVRKDAKPGQRSFILFGNQDPDHPQRGMCGRSASAPQIWDSPLRLRRPLKLVGERGSGQFQEIGWDQALDEIAARLKALIEAHGPGALCFAGHNMMAPMHWLDMALGAPHVVNQSSTCNTAGVVARKWVLGPGFSHHAKVDPDYERARFVLFPGRTLHAPIGAQHRLAQARAQGARAAFLNPAHPDSAFANGEWIPCRPGTDAAFLLGVAHVLVAENLFDADFVRRYTDLPLLLKPDGKPLTAADLVADGQPTSFRVFDPATGALAAHDDAAVVPALEHAQTVTLADGSEIAVATAWTRFVAHLVDYAPEKAARIVQTTPETVVRIARTLHAQRGVVEDTWYNTRNGNDTDAVMAVMTVNALLGNFDVPGGLCVAVSAGVPGAISRDKEGKIKTRLGAELVLPPPAKSVDKAAFPETNGTFEAVVRNVLDGDPAKTIKGLFLTDATLFHRDMNTRRIEEMLRRLDLVVMTDILRQEVCDWSDYVLPVDMFLERGGLHAVPWSLAPAVAKAEPVTAPPEGADPRPMEWIALSLLDRLYPDRAAALGWEARFADPAVFQTEFLDRIEEARLAEVAKKWKLDPAALDAELTEKGYRVLAPIAYGVHPRAKPFDSPSGKIEVYALHPVLKGYRPHGFATHVEPPAYAAPKGVHEFYLVNGKSPAGSSAVASLSFSGQYLADNAVWMNPHDAGNLGVADGETVELTGLDTGWTARVRIKVTPRVHRGVLFAYSYVGGNRQRILREVGGYGKLAEGVNPHWFTTGYVDPITGSGANNASVRLRRLS